MEIPWELIIEKLEEVGVQISLGVIEGVEKLYPLAIREVLTRGILSSIFLLCVIVIFIIGIKKSIQIFKKENSTDGEDVGAIIVSGIAIIFMPFVISGLYDSLVRIINYEWYAIQELIQMIEGVG